MIKTVPNQKVVRVNKAAVSGQLFAQINLEAMELAARDLEAGPFKLWCYFAKNQNNYQFALSSADAEATYGIKIKQYNNAVAELINKRYLIQSQGGSNLYDFYEISRAVDTKQDNAVILSGNNAVDTQQDKGLSPCGTRNITDTIIDTTTDKSALSIWARNEW